MTIFAPHLSVLTLLASLWTACAGDPAPGDVPERRHGGGFSTVLRLGMDLQRMLDKKQRPLFPPNPVFMDLDLTPRARPAIVEAGSEPVRGVMVSAGFIDLANNVAHARAIDLVEPGFFARYLEQLARESGDKELAGLPNLGNEAYWVDTVRNEQMSEFNQIVGMVLAINLAHIYLGHYEKYADKLRGPDGQPVPLASLLSTGEWLRAMRTATKNALEAGLGMTGYIALCEAIDRLPARPVWTEYFLPRDMSSAKLKSELRILEAKFFAGRSI